MKNISFIIHGKHQHNSEFKNEIHRIFGSSFSVAFYFTEYPSHSILLTETAIKNGANFVICCGGDGSLNECANGIMNSHNQDKVVLGVLPMGTGNDFIKTIKSPKSLSEIKTLIELNKTKKIDLGLANYQSKEGESISRYFINITDVGMGGVVAEKLSRSKKLFGSFVTYQLSILSSLISYKKQHIHVESDAFQFDGQVMNFVIANGKYFGSGLGVSPDSDLFDGYLNAVVLGDLGIKDYIRYQPNVGRCEKIKHPEIHYYRAKTISINTHGKKLPIDMDGEFVGYSPLQIEVKPQSILFLA